MFARKKKKPASGDAKAQPPRQAPQRGRLQASLLSLESRLMFDAAGAATAAEVNQEQVAQEQAEAALVADSESSDSQASTDSQDLLRALSTFMPNESRTEIVFVDPTVPNYQQLLSGIDLTTEVIVLNAGQDGIEQMASALAGRTGIDAIHLISHGGAGSLQLGTGTLNVDTMSGLYADELATIQQALSGQADILVYGCDFAEGDAGQAAVSQLARLTGADVQASSDLTGSVSLGGDWDLEVQTGAIETQVAIHADTQADWAGLLSLVASGSETRVNTTTSGTQTHNSLNSYETVDSVAMDGSGNYVQVWESAGNIYGQRYNSAGTAQGSEFVIANNAANERMASVAMNASGAFVVTWERDQGSGVYDIYARQYNASGTALGTEFLVNETTTYDQEHARVAIDSSGNFVVVWESEHDSGGTSDNLYAQRYDSSGTKLGSNFLVNSTTAGEQQAADIAMNDNGFMIVWEGETSAGSNSFDVYARRYDASGVAQGTEYRVNTTTSSQEQYAAVATSSSGSFVVSWAAWDGSDSNIYAQRYNSSGVAQGGEIAVTTSTVYDQYTPNIDMDANGAFVVSWSSDGQDAASTYGVYLRQYDASGTALTSESLANTTTAGSQDYSGIAYENGKVVVSWSGNGTGDGSGIFSQLYDATVPNSAPINTVPGAQNTNEDTNLVFSSGNGNQIAITDADAGSSTMEVTLSVTNGTLTLSGTTGLTFTTGDGTTDSTMTVRGTVASINAALNGLTYSPTAEYSGGATLTVATTDSTLVSLNIDSNLQARYTFEGNANDVASGTAQNGTLGGNAGFVTDGTRGQVLTLDGVDDYVDLTSATSTFGTYTQGTIAAWVKLTATGSRTIFDLGDGASQQNYVSFFVNNGKLEVTIVDGGVTVLDTVSTASVNDGAWHHVAFSVNGSGNQLYIDGAEAARTFNNGSASTSSFFSSLNAKTNTTIGAYNNGAINGEFLGQLDDVRLYNRVLTSSEVASLATDLSLTDTDTVSITVNVVNDAPTITNLSGDSLAYNEGDGAVVIEQGANALVADVDSTNFDTGTLTVSFTAGSDSAEDVLSIRNQGTSAGQIGVSGSNITYGGTIVGTFTGGSSGSNLVITLNSNATPTAVTALVQNITYENTDTNAPTTGARTVRYVLTDGDGGTSANYDTTVTVTAVNDAPAGSDTTITINEDAYHILTVADFGFSDVDGNSLQAVKITTLPSAGVLWYYNGSSWVAATVNQVVTAADIATGNLSYTPWADGNGTGYASFTFQVQDTGGTANGGVDLDQSPNTISFNLTAVNDAPVLADTALTLTVAEDAGAPSGAVGSTISSFTGGITDVDSGASKGIAITGTNETNGTWYYTTNGGTTWTAVGTVSNTSALLLADNASTRLYFAPSADYNGTSTAALTLRAWDQTSGTAGTKVTTASNGGTTAFSSATDTVDVTVSAVNDAPTITSNGGGATAAISVAENTTAVTTVTSSDVDGGTATYSIVGGTDAARFSINSSTGALTFVTAPNYEAPADTDTNNIYEVTVQVSDGNGGTDTQTISVTVTDQLPTGHWTFDANANDSSGNNYNGTLTNGALIDTSAGTNNVGAGKLSLDGSNDYVNLSAHVGAFQNLSAGTITAWVYPDTAVEGVIFEASDSGDSNSRIALIREADGSLTFFVREGSTTLLDVDTAANLLPAGTWTHVAVSVDATGHRLYINGVQVPVGNLTYTAGSSSTSAFFDDVTQLDFMAWGVHKYTPDDSAYANEFNGFMDDARVYDRPLAADDIAALANANVAPVNNLPATQQTPIDTPLVFSTANGNAISISDADDTQAQVTLSATNGTVTLNGTTGLTFSVGDGTADASMTFTGSLAAINTALNGLQFSPSGGYEGMASLQVSTTDFGGPGGDSHSDVDVLTIEVGDAYNDAPVLAGANDLTTIDVDDFTNGGTLVSALIAGQVTDPDTSPVYGIAVIAVDDTNGTWEYSLNGGSTWVAFGAVSLSNARLLAADANTYVRFVPDPGWSGTVSNGITFHAWDQTSGTNGGTVALLTTHTLRDEFTTAAYSNNHGTDNWAGSWVESNDTGGATGDNVLISGGELRLDASDGSSDESIARAANLSGALSATLSFGFRTDTGVDATDRIAVEVSADGGATWITLENITGITGASSATRSYDIGAYATANTQIRFAITSGYTGSSETFYVDNVQIQYTTGVDLGGTSAFSSNSASSDITVSPINDEPTLTATGTNPTFTEDGAAVDLFSSVTASTVEAGQTLTRLDLTVSNVTDGSAERITVDGTTIQLVNGGSGTTATNGMSYSVTVASGTATVSLTKVAGITTAQMQTLVDSMTYQNTSQDPTAANRVVTLTRLDDSGSNTAPNDNQATLSLTSTVTVTAVNDAPVNTVPGPQSVNEDTPLVLSGISVNDVDGNLSTVQLGVLNGTVSVTLQGGATISAGSNGTNTLTLSGSQADINATLATLTYQGTLNYNGSDTLTVTSTDSNTVTDVDTVAITVTAVNDAPVITAVGPTVTFVEGGSPQVIGPLMTVTDVDLTNFDTGVLTISLTQNGTVDDRLQVGNFGTGIGQVGTSGSNVTYEGVVIGTFTGGTSGSDPLVITFNANATVAAVQEVVTSIQFRNVSESPSTATRQVTFELTDGDGGTATPATKLVNVQATNDAPTITNLSGDSLAYSEGDGAVVIEQSGNALVADVDSTNFDTGTLTVSFTAGSDSAEDVLSIRNQGTGAGQIGVSGSNITYGGTIIGTFTGGSSGTNLVITLNSNATPTAVTALVQNITYENTDTAAPSTGARTVRYVLTDGDGGTSANYDTTVTVSGVNDAPTITSLSGDSLTYSEGDGAVVIEQGTDALVADVDSTNFDTGTLTISFTAGSDAAEDVLSIRNQGTGSGQIGVSGSNITYGGTIIGTFTGGSSGSNLVITLNSNATPTAVTALVKNITYENTDTAAPTTGARTVRYVLTDGDGGTSANYDTTVTVGGANDAPVVTTTGTTLAYTENGAAIAVDSGLTVNDVDSATLTGATVQINANYVNGQDVLAFTDQLGITGSWNAGNATLTLSGTATVADYQAALRSITYVNTSDAPSTATRQVSFVVNDGTTNSTIAARDIAVTAINDAPTITNLSGDSVSYTEGAGPIVIEQSGDALVADVDSTNFDTGTLTVSFTAGSDSAEDVLSIRNQGTGAGQIGVSGSNITYGGTIIGTFTGGSSGSNLVITLNSNATPTAVTALINNITYENTDTNAPTTGARTVRYVLTDGDGGTSANYDTTVTVSGVNDAPTSLGGTVTTVEDTPYVFGWGDFNIADVDTAIGNATAIQLVSIPADGVLEVSNGFSWERVTIGQTITKATIDNGWLRFTPDANETGYDGSASPGVGNGLQDYAQFTFQPVQTIAITNPDAELGVTYTEGTGNNVAAGWTTTGSVSTSNFTSAAFSTDHDQVFSLSTGAEMSQVLATNLSTALQYSLSVDVGWHPAWLSPRFSVELWAGGTQLGVMTQTSITPISGDFVRATLTVDGSLFGAADGQPLEIRLRETSGFSNPVVFDNMLLTATPGGVGAAATMTIDVTPTNDAPVITPIAPDVTFVENGAAQVIDATGTITDVDSTNFDTGVMTVSVTQNGSVEDRLLIGNFGTGLGQVGTSGTNVTYEGVVIGSFSGGSSGSDPLVITFNSSATAAAVQEVYRSIQFNNVSDNPSTATRQITVALTDGDGGTAVPQSKLVYVQATNDAPVLTFGEGDKNFTEGALAVMIDALPTVSDLDSTNFDTGTLTITISANPSVDDRVELLNTGMGAGQIGVSGTNVYYGGTLIGTQAGGIAAVPFVVTFNANADATIVGEVMANIRFWVAGDAPSTATRTVEAVLTDGDGGTSLTASKQITVTATNDAPTITNLSGDSLSYSEGDGAVVIEQSGDALVADVDSTNFDTGTLTVSIPSGGDSAEDVLSIRNQGTGAGQIGVSGANITYGGTIIGTFTGGTSGTNLVITLNSNATPTAVTALVQNITYENTDISAPTTGARTVQYVLTDGDGGTSANYDTTVTVGGANDAPVNTVPGSQTVAEDTPLAISGISVSDVDGNLSTVQLSVGNGTLNVTLSGSAIISAGANGTGTLTLSGSQVDINATLVSLSYQGTAHFNGGDTLTVTSTDSNAVTDVDTVAITVTAANDAPVNTVPGAQTVAEDTPLTVSGISVTDVDGNLSTVQLGVLNGTVSVTLQGGATISAGSNGTNSLTLSGSQADLNATLATLVYQGALNYIGSDTLTVTSTDSNAVTDVDTVAITVTAVNDATVVTGGTSGSGSEDTTLTGTLTATDAEGLSDGTVFTVTTAATNGTASIDPATGLWSYSPVADFYGTDSFTVTITDDAGNTATQVISVTVTPIADLTNDSLTTAEDTAISANVLTGTNGATADSFEGTPVLTSVTQGANGTVTFLADGTVTYTPNANFSGTDSFTYTITSGGVTETATVTVTVTAVNDPTLVTGGTSGSGAEDTTLTGTLTATDADGLSDGTVFSVSTPATNGTASIDPATGLWSYTPNPNYNGADSFTVTITDDAGTSSTQVITVTVTPVNDAPVLVTNSGSTVAEGGTDTIDASELAVTDVDNSAAQLTYTISTGPVSGRLELTTAPGVVATTFTQADIAANRLVYLHNGSETTSDSFTVTVNDGAGGAMGPTTVTLTITPVNDTPTITSGGGGATAAFTVAENVSAVTIVTGADVDLPAQALTYSLSGGVDQARFTINAATGALNFIVPPDFEVATDANGDNVYVVQVQVTDNQGASTLQTIQVTVTDVQESVPPPPPPGPVVPPIVIAPLPPTGGPGPGTPSVVGPPTPVDPGPIPPSVSPGPAVPSVEVPPVTGPPLSLLSAPDRPVVKPSDEVKQVLPEAAQDRPLFLVSDEQGRPLFSVLPVEPTPTLEPEDPKRTPSVSDLLMTKLDEMTVSLEQAVNVSQEQHELMARITAVTGTTLSVGFIAWALRSGALVASLLATMPAWRHFDPLPVLGGSSHDRKRRQQEAERDRQAEANQFTGLKKLFDSEPPS